MRSLVPVPVSGNGLQFCQYLLKLVPLDQQI